MSLINKRILEQIGQNNHLLSQKGLAQHLGKAQSTISQWLTQDRAISSEYIIPICKYLGCSVHWLLTGTEEDKQSSYIADENKLLHLYRQLPSKDKKEIEELMEFKIERAKKENSSDVKSSTLTDNLQAK